MFDCLHVCLSDRLSVCAAESKNARLKDPKRASTHHDVHKTSNKISFAVLVEVETKAVAMEQNKSTGKGQWSLKRKGSGQPKDDGNGWGKPSSWKAKPAETERTIKETERTVKSTSGRVPNMQNVRSFLSRSQQRTFIC